MRNFATSAILVFVICFEAMAPALAHATDPQAAPSNEFTELVHNYTDAYLRGDRLKKALYASRINKHIFVRVGTPEYIEALRYLDEQADFAPESIYDLAKSLQLHWESKYATGLSQGRTRRVNGATQVGAMIGMAALGVTLFFKPQGTAKYFRMMRHLMPLAGASSGLAVGQALNASGLLEGNIPISPAHVMRLGIQTDEYDYSDDTMVRDILSMTIAVGVTSASIKGLQTAIKAVRYVNAAATPLKINPVVLVASIVIWIAVEKGAEAAIDRYQYGKLKEEVVSAAKEIDDAFGRRNDAKLYTAADRLVKTTSNLVAYLNRPILDAIKSYSEDLATLQSKQGEESPTFRTKLNKMTEKLTRTINDAMNDREFPYDGFYEGFVVRSYLQTHDLASIQELGDTARARAETYIQGFEEHVARRQRIEGKHYSAQEREEILWPRYLRGLDRMQDMTLASELRQGRIRKHAGHVLMQAAAVLRMTKKEYVELHAENLMSMIVRNDLLTENLSQTGVRR